MPMQANSPKEGQGEKEGDHAKIVPSFCCAHQAQHSPPQSPSCERRFANRPASAQEARSFLESNPIDHHPPLSQRTSTSYVEKSCNEAANVGVSRCAQLLALQEERQDRSTDLIFVAVVVH